MGLNFNKFDQFLDEIFLKTNYKKKYKEPLSGVRHSIECVTVFYGVV